MTILPSAIRGHGYRQEAIDLQPGGATITVTVPSDNPYEGNDDVEIVTQMSGGMAGPDPKMRSRRIAAKGMRQVRPHSGFLPGMGDGDDLEGDEVEIGLFGTVRKPRGNPRAPRQARPKQYLVQANPIHAGFLPGMGTDPNEMMCEGFGAEVAAGKRQKVIPAFRPSPEVLARGKAMFAPRFDQVAGLGAPMTEAEYMRSLGKPSSAPLTDADVAKLDAELLAMSAAPKPAGKPFDWSGLATGLTAGAANVVKSAAEIEAARAQRGPKSITHVTNVTPAESRRSATPWIMTGVGALVAVGVLAFVLTRKKA